MQRPAVNMRNMRCAIYTRKSTAEGLSGEHTSLDNQRDHCAARIKAMAGDGWQEIATAYDDGGYSGGSLRRPALTALRADIVAGKVDAVVVYKIDRLTRSIRDFMVLLTEFEAHNVALVSVTQAFDTSDAMGRLTLNVLLSFAEFERELTRERLREWFAGARSKGLWARQRPFGYDVENKRLVINKAEAKVVREAHAAYARLRSAERVAMHLNDIGMTAIGGRAWRRSSVTRVLRQPLYMGTMVYRGEPIEAPPHGAIISAAIYDKTQEIMALEGPRRGIEPKAAGLLGGLLFASNGARMIHVTVVRRGKPYRYYVPGHRRYGSGASADQRLRASEVDDAIVGAISGAIGAAHAPTRIDERKRLVRSYVLRIDLRPAAMEITTVGGGQISLPIAGQIGLRSAPSDERPQHGEDS